MHIPIIGTKEGDKIIEIQKELIEEERQEFQGFIMGFMTPLDKLREPYINPRSSIFPYPAQPDFCDCL